jgi:endonuclease III
MNNSQIKKVYQILKKEVKKYKVPVVDLIQIQTNDPFKVLIATILSARTKDETTVKVVEILFKKINNLEDFDKFSVEDIEQLIYPVGFYKNKAKFLKKLPNIIKEKFKGEIPQTVEELIQLPGVGRKTANLVVTIAFNKDAMCVDTHVHRISNRLGYIKTQTPLQSEFALREKLPIEMWRDYNSILVAFGQNLCKPIKPKCTICPVNKYCEKIGVGNFE